MIGATKSSIFVYRVQCNSLHKKKKKKSYKLIRKPSVLQRKEHALHPGHAPLSSVLLQFLTGFSSSLPSQCLFPNTTEDGIQSDFSPFQEKTDQSPDWNLNPYPENTSPVWDIQPWSWRGRTRMQDGEGWELWEHTQSSSSSLHQDLTSTFAAHTKKNPRVQ